jgi:hypothetical protein
VIAEAFTATNMKMAVFWDVAQCRVEDTDRRFRGAYCLRHLGNPLPSGLKMEAVYSSETLIYILTSSHSVTTQKTIINKGIENCFPICEK